MGLINIGDVIRIKANVINSANVAVDPNTVIFKILEPTNTTTTYTFGVNAQLVKDNTGNYHVDWHVDVSGIHIYNFRGNGAANAAEEASFTSVPSKF